MGQILSRLELSVKASDLNRLAQVFLNGAVQLSSPDISDYWGARLLDGPRHLFEGPYPAELAPNQYEATAYGTELKALSKSPGSAGARLDALAMRTLADLLNRGASVLDQAANEMEQEDGNRSGCSKVVDQILADAVSTGDAFYDILRRTDLDRFKSWDVCSVGEGEGEELEKAVNLL